MVEAGRDIDLYSLASATPTTFMNNDIKEMFQNARKDIRKRVEEERNVLNMK
jgi:hypothetical protein